MNKTIKQPVITTILIILLVIPILISGTVNKVETQINTNSQIITPPTVPNEIEFAGNKVDLKRMDLRERMDRELMAFSYMHSSSIQIIKRANRYFPIIEPILKDHNIPDDLKYLMVIESNINPSAVSIAGAAGLWQFMPSTGREHGLEVNKSIDERFHIEKSTIAACKYLKRAYSKYGDWLTAAASYNAGQGRITGELEKQNENRAIDLWLVQETSRYPFRILAAKQMLEDPQSFGFKLTKSQLYPPIKYTKVLVQETTDLVQLAKKHHTSYAVIKEHNPWLKQRVLENTNKRKYYVYIPTQESLYYDPENTPVHNPKWL